MWWADQIDMRQTRWPTEATSSQVRAEATEPSWQRDRRRQRPSWAKACSTLTSGRSGTKAGPAAGLRLMSRLRPLRAASPRETALRAVADDRLQAGQHLDPLAQQLARRDYVVRPG